MDKTHSLQLLQQTALLPPCPPMFLRQRKNQAFCLKQQTFPRSALTSGERLPIVLLLPTPGNLFPRVWRLLHPPFLPDFMLSFYQETPSYTNQNTAAGGCENCWISRQERPLPPAALLPTDRRVLADFCGNVDVCSPKGRPVPGLPRLC